MVDHTLRPSITVLATTSGSNGSLLMQDNVAGDQEVITVNAWQNCYYLPRIGEKDGLSNGLNIMGDHDCIRVVPNRWALTSHYFDTVDQPILVCVLNYGAGREVDLILVRQQFSIPVESATNFEASKIYPALCDSCESAGISNVLAKLKIFQPKVAARGLARDSKIRFS